MNNQPIVVNPITRELMNNIMCENPDIMRLDAGWTLNVKNTPEVFAYVCGYWTSEGNVGEAVLTEFHVAVKHIDEAMPAAVNLPVEKIEEVLDRVVAEAIKRGACKPCVVQRRILGKDVKTSITNLRAKLETKIK